ncbi:hypothetical protein PI125_g3489 [Phytophthora idaei]|nr:hypothetical protein PI125_g3489 [Phytophthora idaei]KAG3167792.1 hypothetical protein PI126_g3658 [Phytophthora idaei]
MAMNQPATDDERTDSRVRDEPKQRRLRATTNDRSSEDLGCDEEDRGSGRSERLLKSRIDCERAAGAAPECRRSAKDERRLRICTRRRRRRAKPVKSPAAPHNERTRPPRAQRGAQGAHLRTNLTIDKQLRSGRRTAIDGERTREVGDAQSSQATQTSKDSRRTKARRCAARRAHTGGGDTACRPTVIRTLAANWHWTIKLSVRS